MENNDCTFCKIYGRNKDKPFSPGGIFYENTYFWVNIDKYPVNPGHVEIIPKRHVVSETDLKSEEWNSLHVTILEVEGLIEDTDWRNVYTTLLNNPLNDKSKEFLEDALKQPYLNMKPDAYNKGWNDGREAGRTIDHYHFHVIPRYKGDEEDPTGGVRLVRPGKGNYKK